MRKSNRLRARRIALLLTTCACSGTLFADSILLDDGQVVEGNISGETIRSVTIDAANGRFTFSREKIQQVTRESKATNQFRELKDLLNRGKIDAAATFYKQSELTDTLSATDFNSAVLSQLAQTAGGVTATSETAIFLTGKFTEVPAPSSELLLFAAALCMTTDNSDKAFDLLQEIDSDASAELAWPDETVSLLLNRIADTAVKEKQGKILAITARLSTRLPIAQAPTSTGHLALYAQIEELIRNSQFLQATSLFRPDLFLHRADICVPLAERLVTSIIAAPATDASLAALESARITVLPYIDSGQRLTCIKILVNRLLVLNKTSEAQRVADETATTQPDLAAVLQHLIEFREQERALPANDPIARYKLASWGRSMGLLDEAKSMFVKLRSDPRLVENANLQLQLIDQTQAKETVRRLNSLYGKDDLDTLKTEAAAFLRTSPPDQYAQQTRDLLQLADFEQWSSRRSSQGKAEAEYQQAERLANRREFDNALMHLNRVQLDRSDSEAAQKAHKLRDRIMREMRNEEAKKSKEANQAIP